MEESESRQSGDFFGFGQGDFPPLGEVRPPAPEQTAHPEALTAEQVDKIINAAGALALR